MDAQCTLNTSLERVLTVAYILNHVPETEVNITF